MSLRPYSPTFMPHEPPADADWALAGVARAVKARRAAPAMDASLRIQSSNKNRGRRALQRGDGLARPQRLGVSPRRRALHTPPVSPRPTARRVPLNDDRGRGVLSCRREDRGVLVAALSHRDSTTPRAYRFARLLSRAE